VAFAAVAFVAEAFVTEAFVAVADWYDQPVYQGITRYTDSLVGKSNSVRPVQAIITARSMA
jgi:hypothetical protein